MYLIHTERLKLRELSKNDVDRLLEILGDRETMKFYPAPYDREGVRLWIERNQESYRLHGFGLWGVVLVENNELIGQCGISWQDIDGEIVPEVGYHFHKQYWKKGYATEAARACLNIGFESYRLEKIYIHAYVKNFPSQRIAERLGMKKVREYDKYIRAHDIFWKHVVFAMENPSL